MCWKECQQNAAQRVTDEWKHHRINQEGWLEDGNGEEEGVCATMIDGDQVALIQARARIDMYKWIFFHGSGAVAEVPDPFQGVLERFSRNKVSPWIIRRSASAAAAWVDQEAVLKAMATLGVHHLVVPGW